MMETTNSMPLGKMLAIFLGTLLFGSIMLGVIGYLAPDIKIPGSVGIVILTMAAITAGGPFAAATKRTMTAGEKFRFAVIATVASIALQVVMTWGMLAYLGVPFTLQNVAAFFTGELVDPAEIKQMLPILGAVAILTSLLVCFFGVGFGARNQLKQAERLAAKGK